MLSRTLIRYSLVGIGIVAFPANAHADGAPRSETFNAKGVRIHYLIAGEGDPVVLIHGLHSSAEINWRLTGVFGDLAKDHLVVALDLPGHGRSDKPEDEGAYGRQLVEDVVLLLDHLKIKKAHVVGYSLGGMVAGRLVVDHPDRVRSVLLGGMGWFRDGSGLQAIWEKMRNRREVGRLPRSFTAWANWRLQRPSSSTSMFPSKC